MLCKEDITELLDAFPPIEFAFAYGSGVVEQGGYKYEPKDPSKMPMLDLILVVDNSEEWHEANMRQNKSHYTPLLPIGSRLVAKFQERIPAHLWFNAYVPMQSRKFAGRLMKYGVISKQHMMDDLQNWTNLYVAGRLQKPVHVIKNNAEVESAMQNNLESAVRTSLLMLPDQFNEMDLFLSIASLSYVGDPRMYLGENPKKVTNLVTPIVPHYQRLYSNAIGALSTAEIIAKSTAPSADKTYTPGLASFVQNTSPESRWKLSIGLPSSLRTVLSIRRREQVFHSKPPNAAAVRAAVGSIVARAATMQTLKGLFTVGLVKGSSYLVAKMGKRFLSPS